MTIQKVSTIFFRGDVRVARGVTGQDIRRTSLTVTEATKMQLDVEIDEGLMVYIHNHAKKITIRVPWHLVSDYDVTGEVVQGPVRDIGVEWAKSQREAEEKAKREAAMAQSQSAAQTKSVKQVMA